MFVNTIKTLVDGYYLRLISVGVKSTDTMARWCAVACRCHARLIPTLVELGGNNMPPSIIIMIIGLA